MIDDYAYANIDFCEDTNMVLPYGEEWDDDLGNFFLVFKYVTFLIYNMFGCHGCWDCETTGDISSS